MITVFAEEVCSFLKELPEVKSCNLYGSLIKGTFDEYSDIDIEIDVSGVDNSVFVTKIPELLSLKYDVVFYDYAPSLAPDKYIVSVAFNKENPFMMVDIACVAIPHCSTVSRHQLSALNNKYDHTLKLFTANLKHYLRSADCYDDIYKMYSRIFQRDNELLDEEQMLNKVYDWLKENAEIRHDEYVDLFYEYM